MPLLQVILFIYFIYLFLIYDIFLSQDLNAASFVDQDDLRAFLEAKFQQMDLRFKNIDIKMDGTNALVKHVLTVGKQTSQNIKQHFEENNVDFVDEIDVALPVTNYEELQDLELRCTVPEFKRKLVSKSS